MMATNDELYQAFHDLTDAQKNIREWIANENGDLREEASLEKDDDTPSGRYHAERVLELLDKKQNNWAEEDYDFAQRVVSYAKRSAGIAHHYGHNEDKEIAGSGLTKNEIARRNWGLPARPPD